jgi:hypothetical protein
VSEVIVGKMAFEKDYLANGKMSKKERSQNDKLAK